MDFYNAKTRLLCQQDDPDAVQADVAAPPYRVGFLRAFSYSGQWEEPAIPIVTVVEGRKALRNAGLLPQVEAIIAQSPDAQDWFEYAPYWERTHPVVEQMRLALGLTHEQIDELFLSV